MSKTGYYYLARRRTSVRTDAPDAYDVFACRNGCETLIRKMVNVHEAHHILKVLADER